MKNSSTAREDCRSPSLPTYDLLKDPHSYYFIQSAHKLNDFLRSGKYKIDKGKLVDLETGRKISIDPYVLNKLEEIHSLKENSLDELKK